MKKPVKQVKQVKPVKPMRIKELAEATGVSTQTIHYYLREGLLPPPTKTSPNNFFSGALRQCGASGHLCPSPGI